ncbi:hypothetical protein ACO1O0_009065 [Amphichorda felina]
MKDPPQLLRPGRHASGSQSPTRQRVSDDILGQISPATAVEALSSPTGALRRCLDEASVAEREFAMRTAVASKSIWEWVDELSDWLWPSEGGSSGFEAPEGPRRRLFTKSTTAPRGEEDGGGYMGSLRAEEVTRYEERIEEIYHDMDDLAVEDIKSHVMTNHIMPLSRPTTPMSGIGRPGPSGMSYNKMEDLTAVITAIVVQTLPNLARLSRLLQIWSIRVGVLQRVPPLLRAMEDAEVALKSGWSAITVRPRKAERYETQQPALSQDDFQVMKMVIEKKVSSPGRTLDYMLDQLEGLTDTLPEYWLDRMEAVERGYAEWVAACERKIRQTEWARASHPHGKSRSPSWGKGPQGEESEAKRQEGTPAPDGIVAVPVPARPEESSNQTGDARKDSGTSDETLSDATTPSSSPIDEVPKLRITTVRAPKDSDEYYDEISSARVQIPTPIKEEQSPSPDMTRKKARMAEDEIDISDEAEDGDELELPPLLNEERRGSDASNSSTILHGASSHFGLSSELPEISASPDIARARVREAQYIQASPGASPPSSPPLPQPNMRESSAAPAPERSIAEQDDSAFVHTPLEGSFSEYFGDDSFSASGMAGPGVRRDSSGDQQLRQQISDIIDGIPAKIKLSTEPPNLNPPDLQLPRLRRKPSKEPFRRSASSMSNMSARTATPSFTLSPAKNPRLRSSRSQQEIKVYHLARSTGEAPIKLFIRCVGENGERVMVRVGGGWADLSEYLKDYASHHSRRSKGMENATVEVRDVPRGLSEPRSSPPSRPASALAASPMSPLSVRKTRRSVGAVGSEPPRLRANTPAPRPPSRLGDDVGQSPEERTRSRASSHNSWVGDDSSFLGLAGPSGKKVEMSEENKAWVESVKEKVRLASGDVKMSAQDEYNRNRFGELGKVGGTKRLFRRADGQLQGQKDTKN